jgi:hypothetical protein
MQAEFNGWERNFTFLRADVPFPIIGLDFLRFFGMQVTPHLQKFWPSPLLIALRKAANACFSAQKEVLVPMPKAAGGARPLLPRIQLLA